MQKIAKRKALQKQMQIKPGTGAAGGLGFAFLTFTNCNFKIKCRLILHETKIRRRD